MPMPLATLIEDSIAQMDINLHALASRLGYANTNKGSRRLRALTDGRLSGPDELLSKLPDALRLPPERVAEAVRTTRLLLEQERREAHEAVLRCKRASFVAHAVILTERQVPSQITLCATTMGERSLRIDLYASLPTSSYARQAMAELNRRTRSGRQEIAFFGPAQGFVVKYAWCRAIRFGLDGRALELLPRAVRIDETTWKIR